MENKKKIWAGEGGGEGIPLVSWNLKNNLSLKKKKKEKKILTRFVFVSFWWERSSGWTIRKDLWIQFLRVECVFLQLLPPSPVAHTFSYPKLIFTVCFSLYFNSFNQANSFYSLIQASTAECIRLFWNLFCFIKFFLTKARLLAVDFQRFFFCGSFHSAILLLPKFDR